MDINIALCTMSIGGVDMLTIQILNNTIQMSKSAWSTLSTYCILISQNSYEHMYYMYTLIYILFNLQWG